MARRSARLQKRSPTPIGSSPSSWKTAQSESPSRDEQLPPVVEAEEPAVKTPSVVTATPKASKIPLLTSDTPARTPKNRTPIKPTGEEMHPAYHHASTAKVLDEARWLGFQALDAHTAPPKAMGIGIGQATPTKIQPPKASEQANDNTTSPGFRFRFRFQSPVSALSPSSNRILRDSAKDTVVGGHGLFKADEFTAPVDMTPKRKTVVPRGKMSRYSDVHMKEFKKMDSIANHASAFRADPNRLKASNALQSSSPKLDLNKPESSVKVPNKLKRTQSKMEMADSKLHFPDLKPTQSKTTAAEPVTKIAPTPLKRTQSKPDTPGSGLPRSQATVRMVPPSRDGRSNQEDNPFAKRVKRTKADDAATARSTSLEAKASAENSAAVTATPARKITSQTALPRLANRLMTPTKSSSARSQTVKAFKSRPMIAGPSLLQSPSTKNLFSPTNIGTMVKESVRDGIRKTSNSLSRVRSILRTPSRKFSDDPEKVAAGTHMSPPPEWNPGNVLPEIAQTAPMKKHVNFTSSTLERAVLDEVGKSPSPMKLRAGSEVPAGAVTYPALGTIDYPVIPGSDEPAQTAPSPSRRLTFGGASEGTTSAFSFESTKSINFGPVSAGTIRMVRKSDASSRDDGKKRKLDTVAESSDKENGGPTPDDGRSAKKAKTSATEPPKTPSKSSSMLPRRTPKTGSSISKSRLAFLATPKRGKV